MRLWLAPLALLALSCAAAPPRPDDDDAAQTVPDRPPGQLDSVVLVDGEVVRGIVLAADPSVVAIRLSSGTELIIDREQVRIVNHATPVHGAASAVPVVGEGAVHLGAPEPRPSTDGVLIELRFPIVGTGKVLKDFSGRAPIYYGAGLTAGYRYRILEAGVEGSIGGAGPFCFICSTNKPSALVSSISGFGGAILPLAGPLSAEARLKVGAHIFSNVSTGYGSTSPSSTALPFLGLEPRLSMRFGGERLAFVLALGLFLDVDLSAARLDQPAAAMEQPVLVRARSPLLNGSGQPVLPIPVSIGGVDFGGAISFGVNFR